MGNYNIKNLYQGGYSSFDSNYGGGLASYKNKPGDFGMTTDPRTANLLQEVSGKLNSGVKQIEVTAVTPMAFDSIPDQQLEEVNRLRKITGVNVSLHGPVIDTTGINQQGFSELNRQSAERRIIQSLDRSKKLDPEGNIPVTFHSSEGLVGSEWKTLGSKDKPREEKIIIAVDRDTGKIAPLKEEIRFYPGGENGQVEEKRNSPRENLDLTNKTEWDNKITSLFFNMERAEQILQQNGQQIQQLFDYFNSGQMNPNKDLTPIQEQAYVKWKDAENYLEDVNKNARAIFSRAYEFGTNEQKEELKKISEAYGRELERNKKNPLEQAQATHKLLLNLQNPRLAPDIYVPIETFAVNQSSKTFGNAALETYKKFKDKSPIITIENPPAGFALSTGEDLKNLVEASRNQFVNKAIEEGVLNKNEAEKVAEKIIGATWDVGHINMLRKEGFESGDIIRETEKIAPLVKHVHLSDNFGFEHTELPMGMGNVPIKDIMEKLGQNGFDAKKIIEAAQWWEHFKTPPLRETLEAFGSPVYSMKMSPYWNQDIGLHQGYYEGLGATLPQGNYETFGSNFSRLPLELGGQRQGAEGSRMSGRGME